MKKIAIILTAATLVSALAAQKKPVAPAKPAPAAANPAAPAPAAKPPIVAPATPAVKVTDSQAKPGEPPTEPAKSQPLEIQAMLWGGYNIAFSSDFNFYGAGYTLHKGGTAGGAEVVAGIPFVKAGLGVTYLPVVSYEYTGLSGAYHQVVVPIEFLIKIFPVKNFYLGLRGGYVADIGSSNMSGVSYTTLKGQSFGGQLGYMHNVGPIDIEAGAAITYVALDNGADTTTTTTYLNVIPRLGVVMKF